MKYDADLTYLKKRAEFTRDFNDEKVQNALSKMIPPKIQFAFDAECEGVDCVVPNKIFRNWVDLIPENERSFIRFIYVDGDEVSPEKYLSFAMTKHAFKKFSSLIYEDANERELFLVHKLIWHSVILKEPIGFDFGKYEMNAIFNSLPITISHKKEKIDTPSFSEFYRMIKFAEWGLLCQ